MSKAGWLVNDCLTCIPGTKTLWHDLLENIPGLVDKTGGYTPFENLAAMVEADLRTQNPSYIIRNASYFRKINTGVAQISLLQDLNINRRDQIDVCSGSAVTVFNSKYVKDMYPEIKTMAEVIPIGTDFELFHDTGVEKKTDVIFIGSTHEIKGFDKVFNLISKSNLTFNLVMKDDFKLENPRVKVHNKINHNQVVNLINESRVCICTSRVETLHLAGIECAACNIPVVATNTGIYYQLEDEGSWGVKAGPNLLDRVTYVLNNIEKFSPRKFFFDLGLDRDSCIKKWVGVTNEIC